MGVSQKEIFFSLFVLVTIACLSAQVEGSQQEGQMNYSLINKWVAVVVIVGILAGCATSPDKIQPTYISPLQYSHLDCDQIRQEIVRVNARISEVAGVQQKHANNDAVAMGVGLVIFWPALFFLAGGDRKEELARLKGEYEALQTVAIEKKCSFADEMGIVEEDSQTKTEGEVANEG